MENMRDEQLVYEIGLSMREKKVRGVKTGKSRQVELLDEMERRGLLIDDDGRGNGWRVLVDGVNPLSRKEKIFKMKGHAWLFWFGMGAHSQGKVVAVSDPKIDLREMEKDGPVEVDEISVVRTPPKLRVIK